MSPVCGAELADVLSVVLAKYCTYFTLSVIWAFRTSVGDFAVLVWQATFDAGTACDTIDTSDFTFTSGDVYCDGFPATVTVTAVP
jgi:ABC-type uncharacterized transport system permease subunit